jgi:hypothetical protein
VICGNNRSKKNKPGGDIKTVFYPDFGVFLIIGQSFQYHQNQRAEKKPVGNCQPKWPNKV